MMNDSLATCESCLEINRFARQRCRTNAKYSLICSSYYSTPHVPLPQDAKCQTIYYFVDIEMMTVEEVLCSPRWFPTLVKLSKQPFSEWPRTSYPYMEWGRKLLTITDIEYNITTDGWSKSSIRWLTVWRTLVSESLYYSVTHVVQPNNGFLCTHFKGVSLQNSLYNIISIWLWNS